MLRRVLFGLLLTCTFAVAQDHRTAQNFATVLALDVNGVMTPCTGDAADDPAFACFLMSEDSVTARWVLDLALDRYADLRPLMAWTETNDGIGRFKILLFLPDDMVGVVVNPHARSGGSIIAIALSQD